MMTRHFTIVKKIALPFLLIIILMVNMGLIAIIAINAATDNINQLEKETIKQRSIGEMQLSFSSLLMAANDNIMTGKMNYQNDYYNFYKEVDQKIILLKKLTSTVQEEKILEDIRENFYGVDSIANKIFRLKNIKSNPLASSLIENMDYQYGRMVYTDVTQLLDLSKSNLQNALILVHKKRNLALFLILGASLLAIIIVITVIILTMHKISKPILELVEVTKHIAARDFSVKIQADTNDEIGMLKLAFNTMASEINNRYEELENFAYIVAHDLKSPLNGIIGSAEILKLNFIDKINDDGKQFLQNISLASKRMSTLISDLLEFARAGSVEFTKEPISINKMLDEIETEIRYTLNERNVTFVIQNNLPSCICDPVRFSQVWRNLISNSIKYNNKTSPRIEIGLNNDHSQNSYCFFLKDNGIGIEESCFEKIFMPFQRAVRDNQYEGTGIGLAIVKRVIEFHRGQIWVESKINEGTTFYFTIPKLSDESIKYE